MATQTMTQEALYRGGTSEASSYQASGSQAPQQLAGTLPDSAAFGAAGRVAAAIAEPAPLARLSFEGCRDERIISGTNRYKYFRRPIIPFMNAQPPEVLFAPVGPDAAVGEVEAVPEPEPPTRNFLVPYRPDGHLPCWVGFFSDLPRCVTHQFAALNVTCPCPPAPVQPEPVACDLPTYPPPLSSNGCRYY